MGVMTVGAPTGPGVAPGGANTGWRSGLRPSALRQVTLRTRLSLLTAVAVGMTVAVAALVSYFVVAGQLYQQVDAQLAGDIRIATAAATSPGADGTLNINTSRDLLTHINRQDLLQVISPNGVYYPQPAADTVVLPVTAADLNLAAHGVVNEVVSNLRTVGGTSYRVATVNLHLVATNGTPLALQVAHPVSDIAHTLAALRLVLFLVSLGGVGVAILAGYAVARATIRPVERLTGAAEHVAATQDLDAVINDGGKDELARLAQAFNAMLGALRSSRQQQAQLVSDAGHELRTPLTAIVGNVQVLRGRLERHAAGTTSAAPTATSDLDLLARVERQVGRLRRLVDDLLDVARIEADQLELRLAPCDLGALVRDAVQEQRVLAPERAIDLETPPSGVPVIVHADADRVGQVVTNYLTNALKYAPAEAPIAVGVRVDADEGMARVWVRDEGPGLTPDEQARVWDRFYRVKDVAHRHGSGVGLGLGLAICHTLVERQGGALGVESACGQGCTFWFTLPLAHAR